MNQDEVHLQSKLTGNVVHDFWVNFLRKRIRAVLILISIAMALWGCDRNVDTPVSAGPSQGREVVNGSGQPVVGARLALIKLNDSTGKPLALSRSDSLGQFSTFVVPDGIYAIILRDPGDSLGRFIDSIRIANGKLPPGRDTLLPLGSIDGVVKVNPGDSPAIVSLWLAGTDILSSAKEDGTFHIDLVPQGRYLLMGYTLEKHYKVGYRELEIGSGQKLSLPDTLVIPFDGLASLSDLRATQYPVTSAVTISWKGIFIGGGGSYAIDRTGPGVSFAHYSTSDTLFFDSLDSYYRGLPFLGPWPSEQILYTLTALSINGEATSTPVGIRLRVTPPAWTKRIDSIHSDLVVDTLTGLRTLKWNPLLHPDLSKWNVVRMTNGIRDCQAIIQGEQWIDSSCQDPFVKPVDTLSSGVAVLHSQQTSTISWELFGVRPNGFEESLSKGSAGGLTGKPWVIWRDSGLTDLPLGSEFHSFGGWLQLSMPQKPSVVTRGGNKWESLPDVVGDTVWQVTGQGDSLWMASLSKDFAHVLVASRTAQGTWVRKSIPLPDSNSTWRLDHLGVFGSMLVLWMDYGNFPACPIPVQGNAIALKPANDSIGKEPYWWEHSNNPVLQQPPTKLPEMVIWHHASSYPLDSLDSGILWTYSSFSSASQLLYTNSHGEWSMLPRPPGAGLWITGHGPEGWSTLSTAVFQNEIWTAADGHLWKGKLNLPK